MKIYRISLWPENDNGSHISCRIFPFLAGRLEEGQLSKVRFQN